MLPSSASAAFSRRLESFNFLFASLIFCAEGCSVERIVLTEVPLRVSDSNRQNVSKASRFCLIA